MVSGIDDATFNNSKVVYTQMTSWYWIILNPFTGSIDYQSRINTAICEMV